MIIRFFLGAVRQMALIRVLMGYILSESFQRTFMSECEFMIKLKEKAGKGALHCICSGTECVHCSYANRIDSWENTERGGGGIKRND